MRFFFLWVLVKCLQICSATYLWVEEKTDQEVWCVCHVPSEMRLDKQQPRGCTARSHPKGMVGRIGPILILQLREMPNAQRSYPKSSTWLGEGARIHMHSMSNRTSRLETFVNAILSHSPNDIILGKRVNYPYFIQC